MEDHLEKLILASFLREDAFSGQYNSILDPEMFASASAKVICRIYLQYIKKYQKLPQEEELYEDLNSYCIRYGLDDLLKAQVVNLLQECYEINYNLDYVRDHFLQFATKNKLTEAIIHAAKTIKDKGDYLTQKDYEAIHREVESAITLKSRDTEGILFSEVADDPLAFMQSQNRYDVNAVIKTGIPTLDKAHMAGGPLPGEMYVVSAPPGRGKSTFLVNIGAAALLQGKDVIHIFVGDNTEADGVLRYCSRLTGVPMAQIMLNSSEYLNSWNYVKENFKLGDLVLGSFPIDGPTISDIRSFITKAKLSKGINPKVFILDYIDNCRRNFEDSSYEALGELYKKMKNICEEMELIGWTASQPKIDSWESDEVAGLSSLAESSMKQHIVDGMLTMKKDTETSYTMYVPKLRRGRSDFEINLLIDYERMFVKESYVGRSQAQATSSMNSSQSVSTYATGQEEQPLKNPFQEGK